MARRARAALDSRGLATVGYVSNSRVQPQRNGGAGTSCSLDRIARLVRLHEAAGRHRAGEALHMVLDAPIVRADVHSAEMIKLAANAFLMTRVSFINEIANVWARVQSVAEGLGLDHRLGPHFLRARPRLRRQLFPKDSLALKQLAANSGYHFQLLTAVIEVNELQKRRVIQKLQKHLGRLRGKTVALLGLAFKPNTDDTRAGAFSGSCLASPRRGRRRACVGSRRQAGAPGREDLRLAARAVRGADTAVIVTEWPELRDLATENVRAATRHPPIIDGPSPPRPAAPARSAWIVHQWAASPSQPLRPTHWSASQTVLLQRGGFDPGGRQGRASRRRRAGPASGSSSTWRRPLAAYPAATPVIVACAQGCGGVSRSSELGRPRRRHRRRRPDPQLLGRGGGLRFAASPHRREGGPCFALKRPRAASGTTCATCSSGTVGACGHDRRVGGCALPVPASSSVHLDDAERPAHLRHDDRGRRRARRGGAGAESRSRPRPVRRRSARNRPAFLPRLRGEAEAATAAERLRLADGEISGRAHRARLKSARNPGAHATMMRDTPASDQSRHLVGGERAAPRR